MGEHCCIENELTFLVGALRVAVGYRDRRNYQSGRGASVRKVQYTRSVFLRTLITVAIPHLKDIDILDVQVKAVSVLIGKDVDCAHEVFEVRKPSSPDNHLKTLRGSLWWVVTGVVVGHPSSKGISVNFTNCKKKLCELVEAFWKLEVGKVPLEVERPNKLTGYQHRITGPWKI